MSKPHFIRQRTERTETTYSREFGHIGSTGSGFSFPCDEHGTVDESKLAAAGLANYQRCVSGALDVVDRGIQTDVHHWTEHASIACGECSAEVMLDKFTNTCSCGADYNTAGQLLAPREQWGYETGESVSDILAADTDPWNED